MPRLCLVLALALAACERAPAVDSASALAERLQARYEANVGSASRLAVSGAGIRAEFASGDSTAPGFVPTFVPVDSASYDPEAAQLLAAYLPNVPALADALGSGTFVGDRRRDGRPALVASTSDPGLTGGPGRSARVFVDPETFDLLEIEQSARVDSFAQPVTRRIVYEDFREVDGLRLPFRVRQIDRGHEQQLTDNERQARRMILGGELGMQRQQAQAMPAGPEREAAVARIEQAISNLEAGVLEVTLQIDSIRVGG